MPKLHLDEPAGTPEGSEHSGSYGGFETRTNAPLSLQSLAIHSHPLPSTHPPPTAVYPLPAARYPSAHDLRFNH